MPIWGKRLMARNEERQEKNKERMRKFRKMGPKKNEGLRTKCYVT
jgi:hypothetical protein